MKNPGLDLFTAATTFKERPPSHPIWDDVRPGNVDYDSDHEEDPSDYVAPVDFGRWRNPGQSLRVPVHQGPPFAPGEAPEDVIHGEVVSPAEQDGADKILNGEHESDSPSGNPFVEHARQDLHTPESTVAVHALSGLLSGAHPRSVPREAMDAAHWYLSKHFTGLRVNPHHGTLVAASPTGIQMLKRHTKPPLAISDRPEEAAPTYSLTNKHGVFESKDPKKLVRAMLAFQIVHNEIAQQEQQGKKKDDGQDDDGLATTSGIKNFLTDNFDWNNSASPRVPHAPRAAPLSYVPRSAIFEPGHGMETNKYGVRGGYVAHDHDAPPSWRRDPNGVAYSPGHSMNEMLDPKKASTPRPDPYHPGHTYTYVPNSSSGHTIERRGGAIRYFVNRLHPAARGAGFDHPPVPKPLKPPVSTPKPAKAAPKPRMPRTGPPPPPHEPPLPPATSAAKANDLCPVCVSGYLEPYDSDTHECLNCGSLVKHVGFEKEAARGGLGRGFAQIPQPEGDPLNLASGGSDNPENMKDVPLDGEFVHPLDDEEIDPGYIGYEAPRNILGKTAGEADPLDEHMGKLNFHPVHKPGEPHVYVHQDPDVDGAYYRLTEGLARGKGHVPGWVLTADHFASPEPWTKSESGEPHRKRDMSFDPLIPGQQKSRAYLPDAANRVMGEKSILATGTHPVDDDSLNRAIRDVGQHGRNSQTYQQVLNTAYEPPSIEPRGTSQRAKRMLSSVGNPGLAVFAERDHYLPIAFSYESEPAQHAFDNEDMDDLAEHGLRRTVDPGNIERINPSNDALIDFKHILDDAGQPMNSIKGKSPCATCWHKDGVGVPRSSTHFMNAGHVPMEDISSERLASARFSD